MSIRNSTQVIEDLKDMKRVSMLVAVILLLSVSSININAQCPNAQTTRAAEIAARFHDPRADEVIVVCHRGDWRNYPENSIPAIESVIRMGADMVEIDLQLTKDSVLVLSHDKTIDRCTTGKGAISDYTLEELKKFRLKRAHGVATDSLHVCTLREALETCKDRICVNIDKGYEYYDMVLAITEELGVTDQILIKGKKSLEEVSEKMSQHKHNLMYMPIINIETKSGKHLFQSYMSTGTTPIAYEVCWKSLSPEVMDCFKQISETGSKLWVNTIWGSLCGFMDDDKAFGCEDPATVYNTIIAYGASIIQTDRPSLLLDYLRKKGLHD